MFRCRSRNDKQGHSASGGRADGNNRTPARSSAVVARGIFGVGHGAGDGKATARRGGGVGLSVATGVSAKTGPGVFSGLGDSSSLNVLDLAVFLGDGEASFFRDFFFAVFGLGVGLADFFRLCEATGGSGVSLGLGLGVASSSSPDSFASFDLPGC